MTDGPRKAVGLTELIERTAEHTGDGIQITGREGVTRIDVVYALRSLGYEDTGRAVSPVFERRRS